MSDESPETPEPSPPAPDEAPTVEHAATTPDEAPTETAPATAEATPSPAPVAAATDRVPGRGVFVPAWVAVVVGILVVAGLGFAIGWIAAPGDDTDASNAVATQPDTGDATPLPDSRSGDDNDRVVPNEPDDEESPVPPLFSGAYLGVTVESADDDGGVRITAVADDSPAAQAGLQAGDVVTKVDDEDVSSALDLIRAIRQHEPDDVVTVTYTRNGTSADAKVTLSERPDSPSVS